MENVRQVSAGTRRLSDHTLLPVAKIHKTLTDTRKTTAQTRTHTLDLSMKALKIEVWTRMSREQHLDKGKPIRHYIFYQNLQKCMWFQFEAFFNSFLL